MAFLRVAGKELVAWRSDRGYKFAFQGIFSQLIPPSNQKPNTAGEQSGKPRIVAVIAAGGTGTRMSSSTPKQFLELAGRPVLIHTLESVLSVAGVQQVVVALPEQHIPTAEVILGQKRWRVPIKCVSGGPSRQESVRLAVAHTLENAEITMVHDAVRPLCDRDTMERVVEAAREKGGAVPGLPATETIQRVSRRLRVRATPPREELYAIQTPQCFRTDILRSALSRAHDEGFVGTDESSIVRWAGHPVVVVPGSPVNIKITSPLDLDIAEMLMSGRSRGSAQSQEGSSMIRIGQGFDCHRLAEGRRLILGGVEIPFERGLDGHSDADALSHAICDALLGAAALGDIGQHFPDTDPSNRNRPSLEFLRAVKLKVEERGWNIVNVDATLLAQRPRLAPFMAEMQRNIAESLGLKTEAVSVKATTTEGLNAEGRGEGISAHAVALLETRRA